MNSEWKLIENYEKFTTILNEDVGISLEVWKQMIIRDFGKIL
jgi:hypothetical protein